MLISRVFSVRDAFLIAAQLFSMCCAFLKLAAKGWKHFHFFCGSPLFTSAKCLERKDRKSIRVVVYCIYIFRWR